MAYAGGMDDAQATHTTSSPTDEPPPGYRAISTAEAGRLYGVGREQIRRWYHGGRIQGRKILRQQGSVIEVFVPSSALASDSTTQATAEHTTGEERATSLVPLPDQSVAVFSAAAWRQVLDLLNEQQERVSQLTERAVRAESERDALALQAQARPSHWLARLRQFLGLAPG